MAPLHRAAKGRDWPVGGSTEGLGRVGQLSARPVLSLLLRVPRGQLSSARNEVPVDGDRRADGKPQPTFGRRLQRCQHSGALQPLLLLGPHIRTHDPPQRPQPQPRRRRLR